MAEPWFEPNHFGAWYGVIAGGVGGTLLGILGGLMGTLGPRGIGRSWILGSMYFFVSLGIAQLVFGFYALFAGQPWGIWYGPVGAGAVYTIVIGGLIPLGYWGYRQAEERRLEAEALRKS
jgi:hypothetical protein